MISIDVNSIVLISDGHKVTLIDLISHWLDRDKENKWEREIKHSLNFYNVPPDRATTPADAIASLRVAFRNIAVKEAAQIHDDLQKKVRLWEEAAQTALRHVKNTKHLTEPQDVLAQLTELAAQTAQQRVSEWENAAMDEAEKLSGRRMLDGRTPKAALDYIVHLAQSATPVHAKQTNEWETAVKTEMWTNNIMAHEGVTPANAVAALASAIRSSAFAEQTTEWKHAVTNALCNLDVSEHEADSLMAPQAVERLVTRVREYYEDSAKRAYEKAKAVEVNAWKVVVENMLLSNNINPNDYSTPEEAIQCLINRAARSARDSAEYYRGRVNAWEAVVNKEIRNLIGTPFEKPISIPKAAIDTLMRLASKQRKQETQLEFELQLEWSTIDAVSRTHAYTKTPFGNIDIVQSINVRTDLPIWDIVTHPIKSALGALDATSLTHAQYLAEQPYLKARAELMGEAS